MNEYVAIPLEDDFGEDAALFTEENILETYYTSTAYVESGEMADPDIFFEHESWWLRTDDGRTERTYAVVLCGDENGNAYLDFELLDDVEY